MYVKIKFKSISSYWKKIPYIRLHTFHRWVARVWSDHWRQLQCFHHKGRNQIRTCPNSPPIYWPTSWGRPWGPKIFKNIFSLYIIEKTMICTIIMFFCFFNCLAHHMSTTNPEFWIRLFVSYFKLIFWVK